jgi:predicted branched-subunit amino acid permease
MPTMPSTEQFRTTAGIGLFLLWLGFVALQIRYGSVTTLEYALAGLVTLLLIAALVPAIRDHPATPPVSLGVCAVAVGASAVRSGSVVLSVFAVLMGAAAVVELYNWRTGSELLRID